MSRYDRGGPVMNNRPPPDVHNLHSLKVDNINYTTEMPEIQRLFDRYGDIGDIYIPRDRYTRQSKGFAFVRFYNKRDAEDAMDALDGRRIDGREIRVQFAKYDRPIDEREQQRDRRGSGGGRRRSRSRSRSPRRRRSRSRSASRSRSPRNTKASPPPRKEASRSRSKSADDAGRASGSKSPE